MSSRWSGHTVGESPDPLYVVPSSADLERAIRSVTGVATAEVRRADDDRDRLRISLVGGADPEVVAWAVAATLRERFGIALDPAAIAVRPPTPPTPPTPIADLVTTPDGFGGDPDLVAAARAAAGLAPSPAPAGAADTDTDTDAADTDGERPRPAPRRAGGPASAAALDGAGPPAAGPQRGTAGTGEPAPARRRRAAIAELIARPDGEDLSVLATLRLADREVTGRARGLGTRRGRWRAISAATLAALAELTDGRLRADVDHVTVLAFPDLSHVTVSVTLLGDHGEERFLGAAMVRDDPDRAVMRATLDAVNRRVEPWLHDRGRPA